MAEMSAESIQQRIGIARRDAEALKDRIKRKKDELADTTRECHYLRYPLPVVFTMRFDGLILLTTLPQSRRLRDNASTNSPD